MMRFSIQKVSSPSIRILLAAVLFALVVIQPSGASSRTARNPTATRSTPAERKIAARLSSIPAFYHTLFIKGTRFTYKVQSGRNPAESARSEAEPTIMRCEIVEVSIHPLGLQSEMDCSPKSIPWLDKVLPRYYLSTRHGLTGGTTPFTAKNMETPQVFPIAFSKHPKTYSYDGEDQTDWRRREKVRLPDGRMVYAWTSGGGCNNGGDYRDTVYVAPDAGILSADFANIPEYCLDYCGDDCSYCDSSPRVHEQIKIDLLSVEPPTAKDNTAE